jgi:hypothetical protein
VLSIHPLQTRVYVLSTCFGIRWRDVVKPRTDHRFGLAATEFSTTSNVKPRRQTFDTHTTQTRRPQIPECTTRRLHNFNNKTPQKHRFSTTNRSSAWLKNDRNHGYVNTCAHKCRRASRRRGHGERIPAGTATVGCGYSTDNVNHSSQEEAGEDGAGRFLGESMYADTPDGHSVHCEGSHVTALGSWADEMDSQPLPSAASSAYNARNRDGDDKRSFSQPTWERSGSGIGARGGDSYGGGGGKWHIMSESITSIDNS